MSQGVEADFRKRVRARFFPALRRGLYMVFPVISGIAGILIILGISVSHLEGWKVFDGIYFAFVTGLTVGYGDLVPTHLVSRILAIAIGLTGILLTALLAGVSVFGLQRAIEEEKIAAAATAPCTPEDASP